MYRAEWYLHPAVVTNNRNPKFKTRDLNKLHQSLNRQRLSTKKLKDGRKSILRKICNWFWTMVCSIGMMTQISLTTLNYFEYKITTEVSMRLDYNIDVPAMGLCFNPVAFGVGNDHCSKTATYGQMGVCYKENLLSKLSLEEIMFEVSQDLSRRVINGHIFHMETYFKGKACINLIPKDRHATLSYISQGDPQGRHFYAALLNLSDTSVKDFTITFHDPSILPRGIFIRTAELIFSSQRSGFQMGYLKVVTNRLRAPFKEGCINYNRESPFESHYHCLDDCINEKIKKKSNGKYHPFLLRSGKYDHNVTFVNVNDVNYSEFHDECGDTCPENCTTTTFDAVTVDTEPFTEDQLAIVVDYLFPSIEITYRANLPLDEYIIYIGSILSLWFGWCIYVTPIHVIQSLHVFVGKDKMKETA